MKQSRSILYDNEIRAISMHILYIYTVASRSLQDASQLCMHGHHFCESVDNQDNLLPGEIGPAVNIVIVMVKSCNSSVVYATVSFKEILK